MALILENIRRQEKRSTVAGEMPTIPPSNDHTDGSWSVTDIYEGELFINVADNLMFTRNATDKIIQIGTGWLKITSKFDDADYNVVGLTTDFEVLNLIQGYNFVKHFLKHTILWGDGGATIGSFEFNLGIAGTLDKYMVAPYDTFQAVGDKIDNSVGLINSMEDWNNNVSIRLQATAVGGNLNILTTGVLEIYLYIEKIKQA